MADLNAKDHIEYPDTPELHYYNKIGVGVGCVCAGVVGGAISYLIFVGASEGGE